MQSPTSTHSVPQVACTTPSGIFVILLWLAAFVGGCAGTLREGSAGTLRETRRIELVQELPTQSGRLDRRGLRVVIEITDRTALPLWGDVQSVDRGYMGLVSILVDIDGTTVSLYAPAEDIGSWALPSGQLVRSELFSTFADQLVMPATFSQGNFTRLRVRAVGEFDSTDWFEVSEARKQELRDALAHKSSRSRSTK